MLSEEKRQELMTLNRLEELVKPKDLSQMVKVSAIARVTSRRQPEALREEFVQRMRMERIRQAQEEEDWIAKLKIYLTGDVTTLNAEDMKKCAKIGEDYDVEDNELLFFCPRSTKRSNVRIEVARLVVPERLKQDFLHHYHTSLEGGHQGIGRTYQRIRTNLHWRGLYAVYNDT